MSPLDHFSMWHWLALSAALMILEILVPGVVFLWLGLAAAVTGIVSWILPHLTLEMELVVFAVMAVIAVVAGRALVNACQKPSDEPNLNQRAAQQVGAIYRLEHRTIDGHSKVRIGDGLWPVALRPPEVELPKGTQVRVEAVDGATLIVGAITETERERNMNADAV